MRRRADAAADAAQPNVHHLAAFVRVKLLEVELPVPRHQATIDLVFDPQGGGLVAERCRKYDHCR